MICIVIHFDTMRTSTIGIFYLLVVLTVPLRTVKKTRSDFGRLI